MRPYPDPEPRKHSEWCRAFGLVCEGAGCHTDAVLTYDEFCFLPETRLRKVQEGPLYGFWKQYGEVWGEPRTVREWLEYTKQHIVEPLTEGDIRDLDLFLGHDEFWNWCGGKTEFNDFSDQENMLGSTLTSWFRKLFPRSSSKREE